MPRVSRPLHVEEEAPQLIVVKKGARESMARVIERGHGQLYVHFLNTDKRLDDWVQESQTRALEEGEQVELEPEPPQRGHKRKRSDSSSNKPTADSAPQRDVSNGVHIEDPFITGGGDSSEEEDVAEHQLLTRRRNFDLVNFGQWQMKTWYFSPYPVTEAESDALSTGIANAKKSNAVDQYNLDSPETPSSSKPPTKSAGSSRGFHRTTLRSHGRTADILAGGLHRDVGRENGQTSPLWVCDRCFKYMNEGISYEIHSSCQYNHPPGRTVWGRGNRMIWEIDGAIDKLFCQNLALFGKLFIDVKTLFFDTENFMFYVLTEAIPSRDMVLGFFSKEKKSYDDYNLACIVIFPPHQRRGFGMLLVEFSYVLSRRSGMLGTPERPLSDLGLRGYLTYWISTLIRFFRFVLQIHPEDLPGTHISLPTDQTLPEEQDAIKRRRRGTKGSVAVSGGELEAADWATLNGCPVEELDFKSMRKRQTTINPDGSATTHVSIQCTLDDISQVISFRPEDIAFALNECGLLQHRQDEMTGRTEAFVILSREMVEQAAKRWKPRKSIILPQHLLLDFLPGKMSG